MRLRVQHIVETRFSVELGRRPDGFTREWCVERLELLRRFTLPSIEGQRAADFTWLLLCDGSTDPETLEELREEEQRVPALLVGITSAERPPKAVVRSLVRPDADVLITTQLDSDDCLADAHLATVQTYAEFFHRSVHRDLLVNFPRGYRLDAKTMRLYEERMFGSSFPSLLERPRRMQVETALRANHPILHQHHLTHQDESMHGWAIVVHGDNLANRIRPDNPFRADVRDGFPGFSFRPGVPAVAE